MGFKGDRASVGKAGVESGAVIEGFDVVEDSGARLGEGGEALMVDDFVFEAAPKGLDEGVIIAIAFEQGNRGQSGLALIIRTGNEGSICRSVWLGFKINRTSVSKAGVESGAVVEGFDVVEDGSASLGEGGEALVVNDFVFEAAPEGFDEGVVVAVAFATPGSDQAMLSEDLPVSGTRELPSAIGVDDERVSRTALQQRHAKSSDGEPGIKDLMHGPADDAARADIEDSDEVKPALAGQDRGGVGDPELIGLTNLDGLDAVRRPKGVGAKY